MFQRSTRQTLQALHGFTGHGVTDRIAHRVLLDELPCPEADNQELMALVRDLIQALQRLSDAGAE